MTPRCKGWACHAFISQREAEGDGLCVRCAAHEQALKQLKKLLEEATKDLQRELAANQQLTAELVQLQQAMRECDDLLERSLQGLKLELSEETTAARVAEALEHYKKREQRRPGCGPLLLLTISSVLVWLVAVWQVWEHYR